MVYDYSVLVCNAGNVINLLYLLGHVLFNNCLLFTYCGILFSLIVFNMMLEKQHHMISHYFVGGNKNRVQQECRKCHSI